MGVYIDIEKPKDCWKCFNFNCGHWGTHGYDFAETDCPLIEIDLEHNADLQEFINRFAIWCGSKKAVMDLVEHLGLTVKNNYVEVVRCGECKHGIKHPIEDVECGVTSIFMSKADFCSYGERSE